MPAVNSVEVLFAAAHAQFPDTEPLGGGKAVADYLEREHPDWTILSPRSLGLELRQSLSEMNEWQYARFCRQFERAVTSAVLQRDPRRCVVLANDISEGPDFRRLGEAGYRMATIFHVDVVEYFTKFYLRGLVRPEWLTRFRWRRAPDLLRLVFEKQRHCVEHSQRLIVPSAPMREVIRRCYPWCPSQNIVVVPWGNLSPPAAGESLDVAADEVVIVTLSRLSPEKGIERLLRALPHLRLPRWRVFIAGAPAFMNGRAYERKLRRMAKGLPVTFTGYLSGPRKSALLRRADVFVSPSHHESYGLTIAEALAHGCRVISHGHYGAQGQVVDCSDPVALARAIEIAARQRGDGVATAVVSNAAKEVAAILAEIAGGTT